MTPLALFLLSHGARTIPSSCLTKELIHLGYRPVCFTTWYYPARKKFQLKTFQPIPNLNKHIKPEPGVYYFIEARYSTKSLNCLSVRSLTKPGPINVEVCF